MGIFSKTITLIKYREMDVNSFVSGHYIALHKQFIEKILNNIKISYPFAMILVNNDQGLISQKVPLVILRFMLLFWTDL